MFLTAYLLPIKYRPCVQARTAKHGFSDETVSLSLHRATRRSVMYRFIGRETVAFNRIPRDAW